MTSGPEERPQTEEDGVRSALWGVNFDACSQLFAPERPIDKLAGKLRPISSKTRARTIEWSTLSGRVGRSPGESHESSTRRFTWPIKKTRFIYPFFWRSCVTSNVSIAFYKSNKGPSLATFVSEQEKGFETSRSSGIQWTAGALITFNAHRARVRAGKRVGRRLTGRYRACQALPKRHQPLSGRFFSSISIPVRQPSVFGYIFLPVPADLRR